MISYFSLAHAREKVLLQNRGISVTDSVTDSVTESPIRLASQYGRYGYRRVTALLRAECSVISAFRAKADVDHSRTHLDVCFRG